MVATLRARVAVDGKDAVAAVGVGIAGLVDGNGVLRYGPNLPGVIDAPVREALGARTGLPVVVDNDVNVALTGEHDGIKFRMGELYAAMWERQRNVILGVIAAVLVAVHRTWRRVIAPSTRR